jgi:hypothetical protein
MNLGEITPRALPPRMCGPDHIGFCVDLGIGIELGKQLRWYEEVVEELTRKRAASIGRSGVKAAWPNSSFTIFSEDRANE